LLRCLTLGLIKLLSLGGHSEGPRAPLRRGRHSAGLPGNDLLFDIVPRLRPQDGACGARPGHKMRTLTNKHRVLIFSSDERQSRASRLDPPSRLSGIGGEGGNGLQNWSQSRPCNRVYISRKPLLCLSRLNGMGGELP